MAERFELFRLALLPKPNIDLFEVAELTREEYLRIVFAQDYKYYYNQIAYHYVAVPDSNDGPVVIGRIGREYTAEENKPSTEGLTETTREAWKAALIVVDPAEHDDGQKVAIGIDRLMAHPSTLLFGLIRQINLENRSSMYSIAMAPIFRNTTSHCLICRGVICSIPATRFYFFHQIY